MLKIKATAGSSAHERELLARAQDVLRFLESTMDVVRDERVEYLLPGMVIYLIAANISHVSGAHADQQPEDLEHVKARLVELVNEGFEFGLPRSEGKPTRWPFRGGRPPTPTRAVH